MNAAAGNGGLVPSGAQVEISHGDQRAVVVEVGGGLRTYEVAGRHVVDGYARDEMCSGGRGQILAPWPNRVRDGVYDFGGAHQQLPLTEPPKHNAIHGLVRWASWQVADHDDDRVAMEHRLHPQPGYPFALQLRAEYRLDDDGLTVRITATNIGDQPCPYGHGAHPYLQAGDGGVGSFVLEAPGATRFETDEQQIPVARRDVAGTPYDFRTARLIGDAVLDTAFTDLRRDDSERAWVRLWPQSGGSGVALWMDEAHPYLMLFSGDTLAGAARRRSLGVEPMTCSANAFQNTDGLIVLEPSVSATSTYGIVPEIAPR